MSVSKVQFDGNDLINLESDTVTAAHLESGYTAHDASGAVITGSLTPGITPSGTVSITTNGTHDVTNYASAAVNVPAPSPTLQSKSVTYTSNGSATVTPDSGYDGLSSVDVTVNVSGGGGGFNVTIPSSGYWDSGVFMFMKSDGTISYYYHPSSMPQSISGVISISLFSTGYNASIWCVANKDFLYSAKDVDGISRGKASEVSLDRNEPFVSITILEDTIFTYIDCTS